VNEPSSVAQPLPYASPAATGVQPEYPGGGALHVLAVLTACATFPLIFMGGLVTSHQAGMSVPDWPNSYGYNMFLFPPSDWIGGIFYEHTHRLMGTVVGFLSLVLTIWAWAPGSNRWGRRIAAVIVVASAMTFAASSAVAQLSSAANSQMNLAWLRHAAVGSAGLAICALVAWLARDPAPYTWLRWLATAVFGAVLFQGILGGLRVVLIKLDLAIVHACVAQAFFCLAAFAALATSRWWNEPRTLQNNSARRRGLVFIGMATVAVIYLQLIVGATMRHFQAGLAIPDLPLTYGKLLPPVSSNQLDAANLLRARQWNLDPVTLGQIWLHFGHRIGAILVTIMVLTLAAVVIRRYRTQPKLLVPAVLLIALLLAQLTLGVLTVLLRKPADVASAHVAVGALVLVTSFVLTARAARLYGVRRPRALQVQSEVSEMPLSGTLVVR
jgi:cytochrome c oxidase assembly protein subunit 15